MGIGDHGMNEYSNGITDILKEEVKELPNHAHLFSSEHCHTILYTCDCVSKVRDILTEIYSDIKIIMYIRRQDRVALSYYSTYLRMGGVSPSPLLAVDKSNLNYEDLLFRWTSVFGRENVEVRIFDDVEKDGRSVVEDFGDAIGCSGLLADSRKNKGLGPVEQHLMQIINSRMGCFDGNTIRSAISLVSQSSPHAAFVSVGRGDVLEYMATFTASNEAVRGAYFPERPSLFDEDYSYYPPVHTPIPSEILLALATECLAEGGRIISDLEAKIRLLEAGITGAATAPVAVHDVPRSSGNFHLTAIKPRIQ